MNIKILDQKQGESVNDFENKVNQFLDSCCKIIHVRIASTGSHYLLRAIINYQRGNRR